MLDGHLDAPLCALEVISGEVGDRLTEKSVTPARFDVLSVLKEGDRDLVVADSLVCHCEVVDKLVVHGDFSKAVFEVVDTGFNLRFFFSPFFEKL